MNIYGVKLEMYVELNEITLLTIPSQNSAWYTLNSINVGYYVLMLIKSIFYYIYLHFITSQTLPKSLLLNLRKSKEKL
jgi:hypothetical protein